jgi:hypothetical protein
MFKFRQLPSRHNFIVSKVNNDNYFEKHLKCNLLRKKYNE